MVTEEDTGQEILPNLNKKVNIVCNTDGYGLCMGVALSQTLEEQEGKEPHMICEYPLTTPRYFWSNKNEYLSPQEDTSTVVFGIPYNSWTPVTFRESRVLFEQLGQDGILVDQAYSLEEQTATDTSNHLLRALAAHEETSGHKYSLVDIARVISGEYEGSPTEELRKIALGVQVAVRPSLVWWIENKDTPEYSERQLTETNSRLMQTLQRLRERDYDFFVEEANTFIDNIEISNVTIASETDPSLGYSNRLGFMMLEDYPPTYRYLAAEAASHKVDAVVMLSSRFTPDMNALEDVPYTFKIFINPNHRNTRLSTKFLLQMLKQRYGEELNIVGNKKYLTVKANNPDVLTNSLLEAVLTIDPELNSVFANMRNIAIVGMPNRGKSVLGSFLQQYISSISINPNIALRHAEVDKISTTPETFLRQLAQIADDTSIDEKTRRVRMEKLYEERRKLKRSEFTEKDHAEVLQLLDNLDPEIINILDLPGGKPGGDIRRPEIIQPLLHPNVQAVIILGNINLDVNEIETWEKLIYEINQQRIDKGLKELRILGRYITSKEEAHVSQASHPTSTDNVGFIRGMDREKSSHNNSAVLLLAVLIRGHAFQEETEKL